MTAGRARRGRHYTTERNPWFFIKGMSGRPYGPGLVYRTGPAEEAERRQALDLLHHARTIATLDAFDDGASADERCARYYVVEALANYVLTTASGKGWFADSDYDDAKRLLYWAQERSDRQSCEL